MERSSKYETTNTIEKAFTILEEIISHQYTGLCFSDITRRLGFPKTSTHRILKILVTMGYLIYDHDTKKYRSSLKIPKLGSQVIESFDLRNFVRPFLQNLHEKTNHICHLGVINENRGVYLDKIESKSYGIKVLSEIGKDFPLHCTALGKVLLSFMHPIERSKILRGKLTPFTENTLTQRSILEKELKQVRESGYALDKEELTRGIMSVAAPVRNYEGEVLAAISLTFPSFLKDERGLLHEIESIKRCATEIWEMMGGINKEKCSPIRVA